MPRLAGEPPGTSLNKGEPQRRDRPAGEKRHSRLTRHAPAEFKEIRKEWKARKKEEETQRKADEERHRHAAAAAAANGPTDGQAGPDAGQPPTTYPGNRAVQLPPIGYQPNQYPAPPSAGVQQPLPEYSSSYLHSYPPTSPYGQPGQQMYNQRQSSRRRVPPAGHAAGRQPSGSD